PGGARPARTDADGRGPRPARARGARAGLVGDGADRRADAPHRGTDRPRPRGRSGMRPPRRSERPERSEQTGDRMNPVPGGYPRSLPLADAPLLARAARRTALVRVALGAVLVAALAAAGLSVAEGGARAAAGDAVAARTIVVLDLSGS